MAEDTNKNLNITFDDESVMAADPMLPAKKANYQLDLESQTLKDIVLSAALCNDEVMDDIVEEHLRTGRALYDIILDYGIVAEQDLNQTIADGLGTEFVDLKHLAILAHTLLRKHSRALRIQLNGDRNYNQYRNRNHKQNQQYRTNDIHSALDTQLKLSHSIQSSRLKLKATLDNFVKCLRKTYPTTPIVIISKIQMYLEFHDKDYCINEKKIRNYQKNYVKKSNDKNLYYIDGSKVLGKNNISEKTVDGCHPTDLGFKRMADVIGNQIDRVLRRL